MEDDLISRKALFESLFMHNGTICPDTDADNFPITFDVKDIKKAILDAPVAYDVKAVVEKIKKLGLDGIKLLEDDKYYLIRKSEAIDAVINEATNKNIS